MSTENLREIHDTNNFKLNKGQLSLEKVGITTLSLKQHFADLLESLADMEIRYLLTDSSITNVQLSKLTYFDSLVQDTASLKATRILSNALMKLEKPNTERPATNKLHI